MTRRRYTGPRGDDVPACVECGKRHLTIHNSQSCTGHVVNDRESYVKGQDRKPLPEPRPCARPPVGGLAVCPSHGGMAGQTVAAGQRRQAETDLITTARKLIPDAGDRTPITNPLERLLELASEADAFRESLRMLANKLQDDIRYRGAGVGAEQLRAEVSTYRQALKDTTDLLVAIARLDIEKMLARIESRKVELVLDAMNQGVTDAGLDDEQKRAVMTGVARHLRSVRRPAA